MNDRPEPYKIRLKEGSLLLNKEKKGAFYTTRTPSAYDTNHKSNINATWGKAAGALR
jgi:hypothetical protein